MEQISGCGQSHVSRRTTSDLAWELGEMEDHGKQRRSANSSQRDQVKNGGSEIEREEGKVLLESDETDEASLDGEADSRPVSKFTKWRNIIGFWILGLANNYPYVVMLSAAFDIIHRLSGNQSSNDSDKNSCTQVNGTYEGRELCERAGTSVILLADILPTFIIKLFAPYVMNFVPYWIRVLGTVGFSLASFLLVGLGSKPGVIIFGVVCASISSGFGELTFLSFTARYDKSTVSGWSSGTGAAGVAGALVYAALTFLISPKATLLIQLFMPLVMLATYFCILGKPGKILPPSTRNTVDEDSSTIQIIDPPRDSNGDPAIDDSKPLLEDADREGEGEGGGGIQLNAKRIKFFNKEELAYWWEHVKYIPRLWKYMVPLFFVYTAEYMINQGFFELLYSPNTHIGSLCISQEAQYRILQVMYQIGVLISRSSVSVFHFRWFWILSVLQVFNFVFFFTAAIYLFLPSFWLTIFIVVYEGLLGGGVYVNAFYAISIEVPKVHREFSMGVASIADSTGIMVAAFLAQAVHSFICSHYIGWL